MDWTVSRTMDKSSGCSSACQGADKNSSAVNPVISSTAGETYWMARSALARTVISGELCKRRRYTAAFSLACLSASFSASSLRLRSVMSTKVTSTHPDSGKMVPLCKSVLISPFLQRTRTSIGGIVATRPVFACGSHCFIIWATSSAKG